ncbi:hypothetical protein ABT373_40080 [Streptomyces sp. NPDC000070]|uniref:hypothetical protein n=1 Tax=Streptomyces sp. NPDC000070 TaxID=3154240 RepID=UPI00331F306B
MGAYQVKGVVQSAVESLDDVGVVGGARFLPDMIDTAPAAELTREIEEHLDRYVAAFNMGDADTVNSLTPRTPSGCGRSATP